MPLNSKISVTVDGKLTSVGDLATGAVPLLETYQTVLRTGTGAGQADKIFHDTRTLAASASEDLDMAGATLTDAFGVAFTLARVKALLIRAAAGNTNNVLLGGVAAGMSTFLSPAATGIITIRPGATFAIFAGVADATGYVVTPTTADLLHVANSAAGSTVTYDVIIIGTSA